MHSSFEKQLFKLSLSQSVDSGNLSKASEEILTAATTALNITRASIWLLKDDHIFCEFLVEQGQSFPSLGIELARAHFPSYFAALDSEQAIIADDATLHPATFEFTQDYLKPLNIRSMLDLPIRHLGKMIGVICCEHQGDNLKTWRDEEVTFVLTLAEVYGRAYNAKFKSDYQVELKTLNANLEKVVEERTFELEQSLAALKASQESLIESEKFAAFGELIKGISHELNTPFGIVITSISHALEEIKKGKTMLSSGRLTKTNLECFFEEQKKTLSLAENNIAKASRLIESFKQVSMVSLSDTAKPFNLAVFCNQVIETVLPIANEKGVQVALNYAEEFEITSQQGLLAQVIIQLVQNSLTHAFNSDDKQKLITLDISSKHSVIEITFKDNGKGINHNLHKKVFDPFFTTTRSDGSTGLGLSLVSNIVHHKLGGRIALKEPEERGCQFIITLPYA
ncbi:sensor histidine kinase [Pseudoalteromonas piratica]|uniref:histidine kinase n=1 Tax=Pseudoalteromonas piratica TaxID=1348114 RepID=A0A0A7ELR0_9GAMM|nr:GAF domain-containing sensor histidine kinase [Pseudoalteromonas piratica]AIY67006.1 hypothetical protein OM33_18165 [Pseudoalteromonas piratica]